MAKTTSFNLGDHFDGFVKQQVKTGQYGSRSEVMRAGLRMLEAHDKNLKALRKKLAVGAKQADNGEFVQNFSMGDIQKQLDAK